MLPDSAIATPESDISPPDTPIEFHDRQLPRPGDYVLVGGSVYAATVTESVGEDAFDLAIALADPYEETFVGLVTVPDVDGLPVGRPDGDCDHQRGDVAHVGTWYPTDERFNAVDD
jgi:hypothetical protein